MKTTIDKLRKLREGLRAMGRVAIGFSGGVDSTFLAAVAADVLGRRALAVIVDSAVHSARERGAAQRLARFAGIRLKRIRMDVLSVPHFRENPRDRCYYCKRAVFRGIREAADREGIHIVADGTHADDMREDRPGLRALGELGVVSPLRDAGLTKREIRSLSRKLGLPTADQAAMACLATRIPHGSRITVERLRAVESVESVLAGAGFRQYRARHHGKTVRIEVSSSDWRKLASCSVRETVVRAGHEAGFRRVTVDLEGYRAGGAG